MKRMLSRSCVPLLLAAAVACADVPEDELIEQANASLDAAKPQSFVAPQVWSHDFCFSQSWNNRDHVRTLADVNNDGRKDIVGFGDAGVYLALSSGNNFEAARFVVPAFGVNDAWRVEKHVRTLADINGDGRDDIVGFGGQGVWTALSNGTSFDSAQYVLAEFGYDRGWRVEKHVRVLADVNKDKRADIIAFGNDGVWLALATGDGGFGAARFLFAELGFNQGWDPKLHTRTVADVNGDGRADLVGFGTDGVWTALATTTGFAAPTFVLAQYGSNAGGWSAANHVRTLKDVNNDGKADIVGFGGYNVFVSYSTGTAFEHAVSVVSSDMGYLDGWKVDQHPRFVEDLNGDGYQDLVGLGPHGVVRALGGPNGFGSTALYRGIDHGPSPGISALSLVGDLNNDGKTDFVDFTGNSVRVARSTDVAPPPPPAAPSNVRISSGSSGQTERIVSWQDNSTNETKFVVNYWGGPTTSYVEVPANRESVDVTGLHADTSYCFSMHAENLYGASAATPEVCQSTNHAPPVLSFLAIHDTSMGIGVDASGAQWITVRLRKNGMDAGLQNVDGDHASVTFSGLEPSTNYCVTAQAEWGLDIEEVTQCAYTAQPAPCSGGGNPQVFTFCLTAPGAGSTPECNQQLGIEQPACTYEEAKAAAHARASNWDIRDGLCGECQ
jgi:hypothetical protein